MRNDGGRRSSSFSSGLPAGLTVPDVTLATTTSITSAFSTLSTNLTSLDTGNPILTSGAVDGRGAAVATPTLLFDQDSPDLVSVDTRTSAAGEGGGGGARGGGGGECDYSAAGAIKSVRNTWATLQAGSKMFKPTAAAPSAVDGGWNQVTSTRSSSDELHAAGLYGHSRYGHHQVSK